ncbi:ATP-binding protein [Hahella ganghwensis]|uniref:ATP-binding protein n=1 Tax=Hahella ganghwensis TaxID=286420 RepID=UPI000380ECB6|nr:SbcC/MukB-like Walker B domain-containing protein [Hahella ganghwensis]
MFLKKSILVNWGNIPNNEFEFGPVNLLSGGNGSGKTTAADAIQTALTAAHDYLFTYNPGQDETTQRGRGGKQVRTLASYVLGCDDGSYARLGVTDGYIAVCFHPTQGESASPFTAVICTRAQLDKAGHQPVARQMELSFLIIPNTELSLSDFQIEDENGKLHVVPLDKIVARLRKNHDVEQYDTKKAYLKRLYAIVRGKPGEISEREALNAAKAFSRFMAYKPVKSINDFVAQEILEKKDLGEAIRSVSDLLKTIHGMESEANRLKSAIQILSDANAYGQSYIHTWIDLNVWQYITARHQYLMDQQAYLGAKKKQKTLEDEKQSNLDERATLEGRHQQVESRLLELTATRMGHKPLQQKDELEKLINQHHRQLHEQAPQLLAQNHQLDKSFEATAQIQALLRDLKILNELPALGQKELQGSAQQFIQMRQTAKIDLATLLGKDWVDIAPLENHLDQAYQIQQKANQWQRLWHDSDLRPDGSSLRDQVGKLLHRRESLNQKLEQQRLQKQSEIDGLETRQVTYPYHVKMALEAIRRECPQADACVLCDFVEIKDPKWQKAIEGYIGGARYSIIVDPDWEAEAIRIVRYMKGGNNARVIQGEKARRDCERMKLDQASVINVMEFSHATAKYFLTASYGNVLRVKSEEELRMTRRGITANGLGSGAYSMFRSDIDDSELVFGQEARERALEAKQRELELIREEHQQAADHYRQLQQLLAAIDQIKPLNYADRLKDMLSLHRELREAEERLSQLDLGDFEKLEVELTDLRAQDKALRQKIESLIKREGGLLAELKQVAVECQKLSDAKEASESAQDDKEENLRSLVALWPGFDFEQRLKQADEQAENIRSDQLHLELQLTQGNIESLARQFESKLIEHNQSSQLGDQIAYMPDYDHLHNRDFFTRICEVCREAEMIRNRLKNNILVEKQEKLTALKATFNNTFVTHLCHAIYQAINDGKKILEDMNRELEHHRFGADRESFSFDWTWVPEFKEYWDFFKEVISLPNLGESSTLFDAELTKKASKVRDRLMGMLLSDDEQKAMRELERISDYRNYRNYEIYKEPAGKQRIPLSQYGTGSGGQLETPAYIIRSAAITSAFRFGEGDSHLRMVLVDEAFSKMDESRSREVINYLTKTLGLQLIFIMPTSKSGPFMDLISNQFVFSKCPTTQPVGELKTRVLVDRQKCNQEKIAELWANHRNLVRHQFNLDFMEEFN